jgi:hypothetical protein
MAIEKQINPTVLNEENQVPLGDEGMEIALAAKDLNLLKVRLVSYIHFWVKQ